MPCLQLQGPAKSPVMAKFDNRLFMDHHLSPASRDISVCPIVFTSCYVSFFLSGFICHSPSPTIVTQECVSTCTCIPSSPLLSLPLMMHGHCMVAEMFGISWLVKNNSPSSIIVITSGVGIALTYKHYTR